MSQQLECPSEGGSSQPLAFEPTSTTTVLRHRETKRFVAVLRPVVSILILLFLASLIIRGIEIRISDITISLGR